MTIRLSIDGLTVAVPRGTTVMRAADELGIFIPRYCYHPALSVVGSCRICQVEVKGRKDPVAACYEEVQEGMEILTASPLVKRVRKAVMEFLLLNHPIDCLICDTAGECDLQNFYMTDGRHRSRLSHAKINRKKAIRIGARVVLDQERCILCSRCVRFTSEITKSNELGLFGRGSTEFIDVVDGKQLENNYSGCVVDLCPVGALTDDDFRFKCRVWYLEAAKSICPRCSSGCNIFVHFNTRRPWKAGGARIMRIKPRLNPEVNQYWICDVGRYGYRFVDSEDRIVSPKFKDGGGRREGGWDVVLLGMAEAITASDGRVDPGNVVVFPSPWLTNEALFVLKKSFIDGLGVTQIGVKRRGGPEGGDGFLLRDDRAPNRHGLESICLVPGDEGLAPRSLLERVIREGCGLLILFDIGPESPDQDDILGEALGRSSFSIIFGSNWKSYMDKANAILPVAAFAETEGTYTNYRGRVQRFRAAFPPLGEAIADWKAILKVGEALFDMGLTFEEASDVFSVLSRDLPAFAGLDYGVLGDQGRLPGTGSTGGVGP